MSLMKIQDLVNHRITSHSNVLSLTSFGTGTPGLKGIDVSKASNFVSLRYSRPEQGNSRYSTIAQLDEQLQNIGLYFDVLFVDPFHTFQESTSLLAVALKYSNSKAIIFVHDCMPFGVSLSPEMDPVDWSGVTYAAFRQFVETLDRDWFVVDSDFGIGVIGPQRTERSLLSVISGEESTLDWALDDFAAAFAVSPRKLMRAISPLDAQAALQNIINGEDFSSYIDEHSLRTGNSTSEYVIPRSGSRLSRFFKQKIKELRTLFSL